MMKFENKNATNDPNLKVSSKFDEILLDEIEDIEFNKHKADVLHTIFNLTKVFLGISILVGPSSYSESGLIGGIVGVLIGKPLVFDIFNTNLAAVMNVITVWMQSLAATSVDSKILSYSELGRAVYGLKGKAVVDFFILSVQ